VSWACRVGSATAHDRTTATAAVTAVTAARTNAFAHSAGSRFGTAVSVDRIMPVEYSPVTMSTPRTATTRFARSAPVSTTDGVMQQRNERRRVRGFRGRAADAVGDAAGEEWYSTTSAVSDM
jgi:hypothetical protein